MTPDGGVRRSLPSGRPLRAGPVGLILLRHNFSSPICWGAGSATGTSREGLCERVDQCLPHGCDRVWNVALRPQGRLLWVDNLRIRQAPGTTLWNEVLRGESSPAQRARI